MSLSESRPSSFLSPVQIRSIPKVDLHRHLDCSMRWSTFCELAVQNGLELPSNMQTLREKYLVIAPMVDLGAVIQVFAAAQKVLSSEAILSRLAFEACEDAYNDGVLILELRYAPHFIQEAQPQLSFEKIQAAFVDGIERAQKRWPMAVGLICIIMKTKSVKVAEAVLDFVISEKKTFIGIDLADVETNFDPSSMVSVFRRAQAAGLRLTVHAGETQYAGSAEAVQKCIELLGAERIGHGVQIINDSKVMEYVKAHRIPLEICPWSNYLTQAVRRHEDHPLRQLWDTGILVTLNSDDPGIFDSRLSDDYMLAQVYHHFGIEEFTKANDIAAASSFLPLKNRQKVWPRSIQAF
jgi:adenosine deaminase